MRSTRTRIGIGLLLGLVIALALGVVGGRAPLWLGPDAIVVAAGDHFAPDALAVRAGSTVEVEIRNDDLYAHTFTVDDLGLDVYLGPRSERTVTLRVPERHAGRSLTLTCEITGHSDMVGTIRVEP